ncbi:DUF6887 family protein [Microcoleus vaginatus]|uniref:DUF6887 family protein n=1 Tax=Microcoleus vaginatus TaxID=119532 RepID=UPI0016831517|nr:hypothetical protein [Microcoleus sp. FACHB-84]MBD2011109.1 hypothetical protein [Microcoleus sp. FACHB-45]
MSQVDYTAISKGELKHYFIKNRGDKAALPAYLYRRKKRSNSILTKVGDSDVDTKMEAAIRQQMKEEKD